MRIKISICLLFSLLGMVHTFAQEKSISGTVKNSQGLPQQGVVVSLKGIPHVLPRPMLREGIRF